MQNWEILIFFFIISFINATVGFGGRNNYIALLGLYALPSAEVKLIALVCNIIVVSSSCLVYYDKKIYNWKRILPLIIFCIPLSFLGSMIKSRFNNAYIFYFLGTNLVVVAGLLWMKSKNPETIIKETEPNKWNYIKDGITGGYIGFISSILGIGGSIFIAPVLYFRNWGHTKKIASVAGLFILSNSICALIEHIPYFPAKFNSLRFILLIISVLIGGQIGARIGANILTVKQIRRITAGLILVTGLEILFHFLPLFT